MSKNCVKVTIPGGGGPGGGGSPGGGPKLSVSSYSEDSESSQMNQRNHRLQVGGQLQKRVKLRPVDSAVDKNSLDH